MTKTQKLCFFTAAIINVFLFAIMNFRSWDQAATEFQYSQFDHSGYSWGWPFDMYNYYLGYPSNDIEFGLGLAFNVLALLSGIAVLGIVMIILLERPLLKSKGEKR
jgi:hypothetical protein